MGERFSSGSTLVKIYLTLLLTLGFIHPRVGKKQAWFRGVMEMTGRVIPRETTPVQRRKGEIIDYLAL
jgi:hypothetical protein